MHRAHLACLVLLASLIPASPALAQTTGSASVDISLPTLAEPVRPGGPQNTTATVRYQWNNGLADENVTVELSYQEGPEWLESSFTPSTIELEGPTQRTSGVEPRIVNVTLQVSPNATAYTPGNATYQATASSGGTLPSAEGQATLPFTAGFAGQLNAELPRGGNVTAWGGVLEEVPIELENTANGPISVDVRIARSPADARLTSPGEVRVGFQEGNRTTTANLEVRVPWSLSLEGPVELDLSPEHADRGTELAPRQVAFQLEGNSAVPVPGPGPWVALAAVGLALLLRRT